MFMSSWKNFCTVSSHSSLSPGTFPFRISATVSRAVCALLPKAAFCLPSAVFKKTTKRVCVCVRERKRQREYMCMLERECVRERERERENVYMCVYVRERVCVCERENVC